MPRIIPFAGGLEQELLSRIKGKLIVKKTSSQKAFLIKNRKLERYEIFEDHTLLGVMIATIDQTKTGEETVSHLCYDGIIPGYKDPYTETSKVFLQASDNPFSVSYSRVSQNKEKANTEENPLFRHDQYKLKLADYEKRGKRSQEIR